MPSITVRDVPEEVRAELAARAARNGLSLQAYLRAQLVELARQPDPATLIERLRVRKLHTGAALDAARILDHRDTDRR